VYANLILFAAWSGLRPGELFGLDWRHIDRRGESILVERQWNPKLRKMTPPKNGKARTVYLTPPAAEALAGLPGMGDAVFLSPAGSRLGGSTSHYYWAPVRAAAGHPDWPIYCLRHVWVPRRSLRRSATPMAASSLCRPMST
jgi:integrase